MLAALTPVIARTSGVGIMTPTGASQLVWSEEPAAIATAVLDDYYALPASRTCAGPEGDAPIGEDLRETLYLQTSKVRSQHRQFALSGRR